MAVIPGAQGLGEAVARPQRLNETLVPRAAFGSQLADSLVQFGTNRLQEEARAKAQADAEADAARKAADRAQALSAMQFAADDLASLGDTFAADIKSGQIDKIKAGEEWTRQARERAAEALKDVPASHTADVQRDLEHRIRRGAAGVQTSVRLRDQHDVRVGIDQTIESASRLYMRDPAAADSMVAGVLESLGPHSGLAPDQIAKVGQGYRESSRFTRAYSMVNEARRDNASLAKVETALAGDEFSDMDPQRKAQLLTTVEGYKVANVQKAEADARRRQAEQERHLRQAEAQFTAAQSIISQGKVLSPEYVEQVSKSVADTPFALALRETLQAGQANAAFGVQPLAVQQRMLLDARGTLNTGGTNPAAEKRVAELEKIHQAAVKDYATDPLPAALERGIIPALAPLQTQNIGAVVAGLGDRVRQAQVVQQQVGAPVSPLTAAEAEQVAGMLNVLPPPERSKLVAQIATIAGPQTSAALARQLDQKDRALALAFGLGSAATTAGRMTSELVLKGAQAKKDGTSTKGDKAPEVKAARWRAAIAEQLDGVFPAQGLTDATRDAAEFIAHGLAAERGGELRERDLERAIGFAIGGALVERNGRKVPLPAGIDEDMLDTRLRTYSAAEIAKQYGPTVRAAGVEIPASEWVKSLPGAELVFAGPGRYNVLVNGRAVTSADGTQRIVIGVGDGAR